MGPEALSRGGRRVGGVAVASADLIDRAIEISRGIAEHDGLLATRSGSRRIFARSSTTVIVSAAAAHGNATTASKQEKARMDREADFVTGSSSWRGYAATKLPRQDRTRFDIHGKW